MKRCAIALVLLIAECVLAKRVKRVYNGVRVEGRNVYSATQFSVWISNSHECDVEIGDWGIPTSRRGCKPKPHNLRGGGALISPNIIQTACHVIADFNRNGEKYTFGRAVVLHPYEQHFTVYLGWNKVSEFQFGVFSKSYYGHARCGYLVGFNSERIIYDYGWIVLDSDIFHGKFKDLLINFAPMYTMQHLSDIWEASKKKQSTCMVMGWGYFNDQKKAASMELLHGWTIHLSYWECYLRSDVFSPPQAKFKFVYERDASWDCALAIPHFNQSQGNGDSGSPVTCDNQYVGIASWGPHYAGLLAYHAPIAFLPYENSVEYRKSFIRSLNDNAYHPEHYTHLPSPTPWTPQPEPRHFAADYAIDQPISMSGIISGHPNLLLYYLAIGFFLEF